MRIRTRRLASYLATSLLVLLAVSPASAEIFVQEDFEDANLASRGWYDIVGWGTQLLLSTAEGLSGSQSLEVRYPVGGTGPWMRHPFPGADRVYMRYYRKWAPNFVWPTGGGPHDTYLFAMYGQPWFAPTQTYATVYVNAIYMGPPAWQAGTIGLGTRRILQGESYRFPSAITPPPRFQLDRWYCIETMATMNTPGVADGRLQLWMDGTPIFDVSNVLLRDASNAALAFDSFMFGPYFHGGSPQVQSTWIDALVIADERVGCLGDSVPPAAPTNLQISTSP